MTKTPKFETRRAFLIAGASIGAAAPLGLAANKVFATPKILAPAVNAPICKVAAGEGVIPTDLLGHLLGQVGRLQRQVLSPRGLTFTGLSDRESEVLRLIADGHDTNEIARQLSYSQRTVKNVLHDVTTRLQLRNRSHAVAYAVREGLI